MIVEFKGGIESASGTLCKTKRSRIIVTTRKAASSNPNKIRMYLRSNDSYKRKGKPSEKELAARALFAKRRAFVDQLVNSGKCRSKADAWKIAKQEIL